MSFEEKLKRTSLANNSLLCVGLDTDLDKIPSFLAQDKNPLFTFNKAIIENTHDLVCAYKPNTAFYEKYGDIGIKQLQLTCNYIQEQFPEIPIIIDAKRGDVGNTNKGYADFIFSYLEADAVTVIPYLGLDELLPFFETPGKGIIIGCHSSNPGAKDFQELLVSGTPLYEIVAQEVMRRFGNRSECMIFMGATYPKQLQQIRTIVGDMTILTPGVGAQQAELTNMVRLGINTNKEGLIINASRSVLYQSTDLDYAKKARLEAERLRREINTARSEI